MADLLVGLGEALVLAAYTIPNSGNEEEKIESPWWAFQVFGSSTSVLFLVLISLERVYSVLWQFRHRVTSTCAYVYSIVIVWVTGVCMSGESLLEIYLIDNMYIAVPTLRLSLSSRFAYKFKLFKTVFFFQYISFAKRSR